MNKQILPPIFHIIHTFTRPITYLNKSIKKNNSTACNLILFNQYNFGTGGTEIGQHFKSVCKNKPNLAVPKLFYYISLFKLKAEMLENLLKR